MKQIPNKCKLCIEPEYNIQRAICKLDECQKKWKYKGNLEKPEAWKGGKK